MATLVKGQSSIYLMDEVTEGTFLAETLPAQAIEPLQDGLEFNLQREEIERKTLTNTIESVEPRLGLKTVTGSIPLEFKAGPATGDAPRGQILYESLMGGKRQILTSTTSKSSGNTASFIAIEDADISKFKKGDSVLVKEAGDYAVRPIATIEDGAGIAGLHLAIPLMSAPSDSVVIEKVTTYYHDSASPSFSAAHYIGGEILESVSGLKTISASLDNWTANQTPNISFSVEGLNITRALAAPSVVADFSNDSKVPVLQNACAWLGTEEIDYSELGLSIENTKADLPSACSESGKIGTRKTAFAVSGSINPYMSDSNLDRWSNFENGAVTSLFTYAFNPTSVAGEFNQAVAIWMPNIKITNMPSKDQDGVLLDAIEFKCFRNLGNDTLFLSFI
jgi:hypothetical protein